MQQSGGNTILGSNRDHAVAKIATYSKAFGENRTHASVYVYAVWSSNSLILSCILFLLYALPLKELNPLGLGILRISPH